MKKTTTRSSLLTWSLPFDMDNAITLKPSVVISPYPKRKQGNRHNDSGGSE
ncbi:MAG: hypothetical protein H9847_00195 [Candidatus Anaerobiospirillum pullicola]|uniref:Uncharacterized protein n=1 Tax=Candidatus Anaerobiospirillum pullicola TaxID=2838451 RepID=A0A948TDW2_9GAMM|nr:hypothetical protein [Candidatus Anaerobiospirillum pullicola]